jgi:nucleoid DNA-binding protein
MNKADLVTAVAAQADLTKEKADAAVSAIVEQITNALSRDESVTLIGFGTFSQSHRAARTGAAIEIKASNSVNFKAGKALKDSVNS